MAATHTSAKKTSRERARARRTELDAARAERDARIEAAAAVFFDADDSRAQLAERIRRIDTECAAAIAALVELKEPNSRIAALLEITVTEVRRLRELTEVTPDQSAAESTEGAESAESALPVDAAAIGDTAETEEGATPEPSQWAPGYATAS